MVKESIFLPQRTIKILHYCVNIYMEDSLQTLELFQCLVCKLILIFKPIHNR